uniref:Uncharacterized protein n=1 Tax=Anguilla anguilla TaxID=7936 RepID=A0A0E9PG86_ANGAN
MWSTVLLHVCPVLHGTCLLLKSMKLGLLFSVFLFYFLYNIFDKQSSVLPLACMELGYSYSVLSGVIFPCSQMLECDFIPGIVCMYLRYSQNVN